MMRKLLIRFLPLILVAAVVIFSVIGVKEVKAQKQFTKTTAVITEITEDFTGKKDNDMEYHVFVRYEAGGNEYESQLDSYSSSMKVGKEISVVYNPDQPTEVKAAGLFGAVMYLGMAVLCLFAAVITIIKRLSGRI